MAGICKLVDAAFRPRQVLVAAGGDPSDSIPTAGDNNRVKVGVKWWCSVSWALSICCMMVMRCLVRQVLVRVPSTLTQTPEALNPPEARNADVRDLGVPR